MVGSPKEKKRKVLVTGSSGMFGTDLCQELLGDYSVVGLDLIGAKAPGLKPIAHIECDITDKAGVLGAVLGEDPDHIIHVAAWTDVNGCEADPAKARTVNVEGTENVVYAASKKGVPLIYVSTDFVFDGRKGGLYSEKDLPDPINMYGRTKLEGEEKVRRLDDHVIVRTSWLYGLNGPSFVKAILSSAKKEKTLKVVDDQTGSPTYTKDLAEAIKILLGSKVRGRGLYHICNKGTVSRYEYAKEILLLAGRRDVGVEPVKSDFFNSPVKRPAFSGLDNSLFEKDAGFAMKGWRDALKRFIVSIGRER